MLESNGELTEETRVRRRRWSERQIHRMPARHVAEYFGDATAKPPARVDVSVSGAGAGARPDRPSLEKRRCVAWAGSGRRTHVANVLGDIRATRWSCGATKRRDVWAVEEHRQAEGRLQVHRAAHRVGFLASTDDAHPVLHLTQGGIATREDESKGAGLTLVRPDTPDRKPAALGASGSRGLARRGPRSVRAVARRGAASGARTGGDPRTRSSTMRRRGRWRASSRHRRRPAGGERRRPESRGPRRAVWKADRRFELRPVPWPVRRSRPAGRGAARLRAAMAKLGLRASQGSGFASMMWISPSAQPHVDAAVVARSRADRSRPPLPKCRDRVVGQVRRDRGLGVAIGLVPLPDFTSAPRCGRAVGQLRQSSSTTGSARAGRCPAHRPRAPGPRCIPRRARASRNAPAVHPLHQLRMELPPR